MSGSRVTDVSRPEGLVIDWGETEEGLVKIFTCPVTWDTSVVLAKLV